MDKIFSFAPCNKNTDERYKQANMRREGHEHHGKYTIQIQKYVFYYQFRVIVSHQLSF